MHKIRLAGSHYEMGVELGKFFLREQVTFPIHLDQFQIEHGRRSEKILREIFPQACREIQGVSDTLGLDYLTFASWMLCMGCCMYNLERNIPGEVRGCTAFACCKEGKRIYGRNNDLPPYLREGCKSEWYIPKNGNEFILNTSSFINGEEGLNEHGLAVAMTFVMTGLDKIRPGLNSCFLVRYLLEKADTVGKAIALLMDLPVASNCNILLADSGGDMAVVECTPFQKKVRNARGYGEEKLICTVNSFTSPEMRPYDDSRGNDYDSEKRYQVVLDAFADRFQGDVAEDVKALLRGEYGFMCQYDREPDFETVWSSVFDLESLRIFQTEGDPRKYLFALDDRLCRHP